jgi:hypothetical protein
MRPSLVPVPVRERERVRERWRGRERKRERERVNKKGRFKHDSNLFEILSDRMRVNSIEKTMDRWRRGRF